MSKLRLQKSKIATSVVNEDVDIITFERMVPRTPSPTPSEAEILSRNGMVDWNAMKNWKYWMRKERICECRPFSITQRLLTESSAPCYNLTCYCRCGSHWPLQEVNCSDDLASHYTAQRVCLFFDIVASTSNLCFNLTNGISRLDSMPAGWLIPIAILVVLSFPPVRNRLGLAISVLEKISLSYSLS